VVADASITECTGRRNGLNDIPDFSSIASAYAEARPVYPRDLFAWLASVCARREAAWDVATGNGQAALGLADFFARVIATDHSDAQIRNARTHERVEYRVAPAESSGLAPASADLVTVAAALHWFDRPRFYDEVRRVVRPGGVLAAWSYHVAHVEPPHDKVLWPFYRDLIKPYFAAGARLVDDRYASIVLPGERLEAPSFVLSARWNPAQLLGFVRTWSGVQSYMKATGQDPAPDLVPDLVKVFGAPDAVQEVRWPIYLLASRL